MNKSFLLQCHAPKTNVESTDKDAKEWLGYGPETFVVTDEVRKTLFVAFDQLVAVDQAEARRRELPNQIHDDHNTRRGLQIHQFSSCPDNSIQRRKVIK